MEKMLQRQQRSSSRTWHSKWHEDLLSCVRMNDGLRAESMASSSCCQEPAGLNAWRSGKPGPTPGSESHLPAWSSGLPTAAWRGEKEKNAIKFLPFLGVSFSSFRHTLNHIITLMLGYLWEHREINKLIIKLIKPPQWPCVIISKNSPEDQRLRVEASHVCSHRGVWWSLSAVSKCKRIMGKN